MSYDYVDACRLPVEGYNKKFMRIGQRPFPTTGYSFSELVDSLGRERLRSYRAHANGRDDLAIRLYSWNARIADALRFSLEITENAFSNVIDKALSDRFLNNWHENEQFLNRLETKPQNRFNDFYLRTKNGRIRSKQEVIENIPISFWKHLFTPNFIANLWKGRINIFFNNKNSLEENDFSEKIRENLLSIIEIRNKLAHNSPIWTPKSPTEIHREILDFVELFSREARNFISYNSYISDIIRCKPSSAPERSIEYSSIECNNIFSCDQDLIVAIEYLKLSNEQFIIVNSDFSGNNRNYILRKEDIAIYLMDNIDCFELFCVEKKISDLKDKFSKLTLSKDILPESSLREVFKKDKSSFNNSFILTEDISDKDKCRVFNIINVVDSETIWVPNIA